MKKVFLTLSILFFVAALMPAMAQKGAMKIGPQLAYGFEAKTLGIGAKFTYGITDEIRLNPGFVYFLPKDGLNSWELNLDGNYLFGEEDDLCFYGLAGLNVMGTSFSSDYDDEYDYSSTDVGLNLGGGAQYPFSEKMKGFAELKYATTVTGQLAFAAGLLFSL